MVLFFQVREKRKTRENTKKSNVGKKKDGERREKVESMKFAIFGPQGSGKGTYASRLAPHYGIPHISTGDLCREEAAKGTELGKKIKKIMDEGGLQPDEVITKMLKHRLEKADAQNGFILDGYPRTLNQAEALEKLTKLDAVINLVVPEWILIKRLGARIQCKNCGAIFNLLTLKPKKEGICDKCGGPLYQRDDDKPEAVKKRLAIYHEQSAPLIDYYRKKGIVIDVHNDKLDTPPEIIVNLIIEKLSKFKK
jgi:adenylate kinase